MDGLSIVRQHLLTAGRKEDPRHAGRKEIPEEWERARGVRYYTPKTLLIYWMISQTYLKVVLARKRKLPELWKYKDLPERPLQSKMPVLLSEEEFDYFQVCTLGPTGPPAPKAGKAPLLQSTASLALQTRSGIPSADGGGCRAEWGRGLHRPAYGPLLACRHFGKGIRPSHTSEGWWKSRTQSTKKFRKITSISDRKRLAIPSQNNCFDIGVVFFN